MRSPLKPLLKPPVAAHQLMRQEPGWRWRDPLANYIMFEPLKLQDAYVTIRSKFPQVDVLLFGPAFFSKAHQVRSGNSRYSRRGR